MQRLHEQLRTAATPVQQHSTHEALSSFAGPEETGHQTHSNGRGKHDAQDGVTLQEVRRSASTRCSHPSPRTSRLSVTTCLPYIGQWQCPLQM